MSMKFDGTINLGHVLTITAMIVGGAVAYTNIQVSLAELSLKMVTLGEDVSDMRRAQQGLEARIRAMEMRVK